jgi:hypothetical protein
MSTSELEAIMKIELHLDITNDSGVCQSISLEATDMESAPSIGALGLSLANGKACLSKCPGQVFSHMPIGCLIADFCSKALGGKLPSLECSRWLLSKLTM